MPFSSVVAKSNCSEEATMTRTMMAALAGLGLLAGASAMPAQAQGVPGGSYMQTCTNVHQRGDRLFAECRRMDGGWQRTTLDVDRCRGGVANTNGSLTCNGGRGEGRYEGYGSSRPYQRDYYYGR
jgi:hypothetical protein